MNKIKDLLKGFAIGVANVIPGVSGGTIAVIVGIYHKIINAISNFTSHPIQSIKSVWIYIVGLVIGIVFAVFAISYLYDHIPVATSFLFVGFILGSIPFLCKDVEYKSLTHREFLAFTLMLILVAIMPFIGITSVNSIVFNVSNLTILFALGALAAMTMIIPGISGSMMLMIFGYYTIILDLLKNILIGHNIVYILFFGFGALVGLILIARVIRYLLANKASISRSAIIGLVIGSPIPVISYLNFANVPLYEIILAIITLGFGFIFSYRLSLTNKD